MPSVWVGTKELFWLDSVLGKIISDQDAPPELFLLAGRVKKEIERLEIRESSPHVEGIGA